MHKRDRQIKETGRDRKRETGKETDRMLPGSVAEMTAPKNRQSV